jgi:hypothetical protein
MSRAILTLLSMPLLCALITDQICAQTIDGRVQPYSYAGLSLPSPEGVGLGMIGGGMDVLVHRSWGVGGEFGYITTPNPFIAKKGGFHLSPTASYRFWAGSSGRDYFFLVGGPALFILPGRTSGGVTAGIGYQAWFLKHAGYKLEIRSNVLPREDRDPYNTGRISGFNLGVRIALSFR